MNTRLLLAALTVATASCTFTQHTKLSQNYSAESASGPPQCTRHQTVKRREAIDMIMMSASVVPFTVGALIDGTSNDGKMSSAFWVGTGVTVVSFLLYTGSVGYGTFWAEDDGLDCDAAMRTYQRMLRQRQRTHGPEDDHQSVDACLRQRKQVAARAAAASNPSKRAAIYSTMPTCQAREVPNDQ